MKTAIEILKEVMSRDSYCGNTYFHFLDTEEITLILEAMELYKNQDETTL
jgi:hypothetical protein